MRFTIALVPLVALGWLGAMFSPAAVLAQTPDPILVNPGIQPTSRQLSVLQASGIKVALPSWVPDGFQLDRVLTLTRRTSRVGGYQYTAVYQKVTNTGTQCFAIEATTGGIGDLPTGYQQLPVNSATFGQGTLNIGLYGVSGQPTLLSSWLSDSQGNPPTAFYRFAGSGVNPELLNCSNLTPQEAVAVLNSLQYVGNSTP